jgi:two-component system, LytTR family, response regulator
MKLNVSRPRASGKQVTAQWHEMAEKKPCAPTDRVLDPIELGEPTNLTMGKDDRTLRPEDFVFLSDNRKCWLIRTAEILLLEACGDRTRIHLPDGTVVVQRPLRNCECRLDSATFFRATRDCVINLTHVKQTRLLDSSRVLFLLPNGREVIVSGRQNVLFRKMRAL